jgi:hypothetical protein
MSEGIQDIETDLITPDSIADEVCAVGLVGGGLLALHRAIATLAPYRVRCYSLLSPDARAHPSPKSPITTYAYELVALGKALGPVADPPTLNRLLLFW